jgi:phage FluMu protein Com
MTEPRPIRCPGCHKLLCEDAQGVARLRFTCRHCDLQVVVRLEGAVMRIVATA